MGLFDGERSSADFAMLFGIPVLAVIDGRAMAQTFGALAHGLASYREALPFAGVFANRVASENHYQLLVASLPTNLIAFGWLKRDDDITLPDRHLGLVQASEIDDLDYRIARAATALQDVPDSLPAPVTFNAPHTTTYPLYLANIRIAIARDTAFSFLYRANLDLLRTLGAELSFFSLLDDSNLPEADAVYLPGGYPELHLEQLATNQSMKVSIQAHHYAGKPIIAECGGMLYLFESITDAKGCAADMVGLLSGHATMLDKLGNLGLHSIELPDGSLRGHTFHYSTLESALKPVATSVGARNGRRGESVYRQGRLNASYLHLYFPSNPMAAAQLFTP